MVPLSALFASSWWSWYVHVPAFAKAWVTFVCPAPIVPRPASIDGQLPCSGCGSDAISCERLSLLMNVTVWPTATTTALGLTPAPVMVTVAPLTPVTPPSRTMTATELGDVDEPPQAASTPTAMTEQTKRT